MHVSCERNPRPYDRGFDFHQFDQRTDFSPSTKMLSMEPAYLVGKPRLRIFWKHISRKGICMDCLPFVSTMPTFYQLRNGMQLMEMSNCLDYRHSYPLKCDSLPWNSKFPSSSKTNTAILFLGFCADLCSVNTRPSIGWGEFQEINYLNEFCCRYQVDRQVNDVDQAAEEKVPIIVDKTSTMWVIHIMFSGLEWAHIDTHITGFGKYKIPSEVEEASGLGIGLWEGWIGMPLWTVMTFWKSKIYFALVSEEWCW